MAVAGDIRIGRERQYRPCISISARCWSVSSVNRTKPYPRDMPVTGSSMILALLQLKKGRMNLGSRSFRRPRTGFRNTATRSELDVSGARSPTNMLYSFGNCGCAVGTITPAVWKEGVIEPVGAEEAQLRTKGLFEFGIVTGCALPPPFTWLRTEEAIAGEGNVR